MYASLFAGSLNLPGWGPDRSLWNSVKVPQRNILIFALSWSTSDSTHSKIGDMHELNGFH